MNLKRKNITKEQAFKIACEENGLVYSRPPLGLLPHKFWVEERINDILNAMHRYVYDDREVPIEWLEEYNQLTKDLNN